MPRSTVTRNRAKVSPVRAKTGRYVAPKNDHISRAFKDIVPIEYRGTDQFLDVVTWNLRWFEQRDRQRVLRVIEVLNALNADLLVLEEIEDGSLDAVAQALTARGAGSYKVKYGTTGGDQRVAFMYDMQWTRAKDDIGEIFGKGTVIASNGKDAFHRLPLRGWFTALRQGERGFDFQLVGVHLKSKVASRTNRSDTGESQRRKSAEALVKWLTTDAERVDSDVIILGDWNATPSESVWSPIHQLENAGKVAFRSINDENAISHLMYKNSTDIGSRLDLGLVSMSAVPEIARPPETVLWKSLKDLLEEDPKPGQLKQYIKDISENLTDHMPVVTRFYFEDES